jgi:hypothetical protein
MPSIRTIRSLRSYTRGITAWYSAKSRRGTPPTDLAESSRLERKSKKDLIVKREFHPTILLFLILYLAAGLGVRLLVPLYVTASLLFGLENYLGYLHVSAKITLVTSRVVPTLRRVPRFEAPIHVPRSRNPSPQPPPPYVRGPRVILEEETDESVSDSN